MNRRSFLYISGATTLSALAGCSGQGPVDEVQVYNGTDAWQTISLVLTRTQPGQKVLIDDTIKLKPSASKDYPNPLDKGGTFKVEVKVDEMTETYKWEEENAEPDASGISISIDENELNISSIVA